MPYRETAANLNTNTLPWGALDAIIQMDRDQFVGTSNYMGVAYFWAHEYRHTMRPTTYANRRLVHRKLLEAGYEPTDTGPDVWKIIDRWARPADV